MPVEALPPNALCTPCEPSQFTFETTDDLEVLTDMIGQSRAQQAVQFGLGIQRMGYNLYVMGPAGTGKHTMVRSYLEQEASGKETPPDWCYVNNFEQSHKPHALRLPPGRSMELRRDMEHLIEELGAAIPAVFESDEYRARVQAIEDEYKEKQEHAFNSLTEEATKRNVKLFRTPSGFAFAPTKDGEILGPDEFGKLPEQEQRRIEQVVAVLQEHLQAIIEQIPQWHKESRERVKALEREVTKTTVDRLMAEIKNGYAELPEVQRYLENVGKDVIENVDDFRGKGEETTIVGRSTPAQPTAMHRYKVNVLVDNGGMKGAPVVYLDHPTYLNLVGRAEHMAQFGTLVTDFTLLKPGALHQASGGYLIVDMLKLLRNPFAWEGLKRALNSNEIHIESLEKMLSLVSTVALEPEPMPLNTKVVLVGDRLLYYLLYEYDPDFGELFKVAADFEEQVDRSPDNNLLYARLIATVAQKEKLRPLDRQAVARTIEYGARLVEDAQKLSTHMRSIADLLREADYWAGMGGREVVTADDIEQTIAHQIQRASRVKERIQEEIQRGTLLIDTEGSKVGQLNGLSVRSLGTYTFGQPSRITATVHIGEGSVVDIEREVELGGAIHSKGVLILSSFIAARYAQKQPLSLSASLVFEQSYGMVEGDSASMAELCALLSALAELPVKQSLALTGSVNQRGEIQPIGGVNEKIEGFFEVCKARGLDGSHGVLIPVSNVKHLMLRREVTEAAAAGLFHVFPVENVDQAVALLTGTEAGERDAKGDFPPDTVNGRVQARLGEMSRIRQAYIGHGDDTGDSGTDEPQPGG